MSDPNQSQSDSPNTRLEAYLDDRMTISDREAFEVELASDQELRRQCDLQREIDESLGRMFAVPAPPIDIIALSGEGESAETLNQLPDRKKAKPRKPWQTVVAVLVACIAWLVVGKEVYRMYQDGGESRYGRVALAEIYQRSVDGGFIPKWVCDDDQEFAQTFQERQGLPLLLKPDAQHMMVGLSYLTGVTAKTTTMLARVEDQPILVFVERLDREVQPDHPSWSSGLKLFRQELGELVLYEVTPLSEPRVIQHFFIPDTANASAEIPK
jgi:hypothetical protein